MNDRIHRVTLSIGGNGEKAAPSHSATMAPRAELSYLRRNRASSQVASAMVCLIGCIGLLGWIGNVQFLKRVAPGLTVMKPNLAFGLTLCGAALLLLTQKSGLKWARHLVTPMSILVISLGALTLTEYIFI
jgi:hypothetical protein